MLKIRFCLFAVVFISFRSFVFAQTQDSLNIHPNVLAIVEAEDTSVFAPSYVYFIKNYQGSGFSIKTKDNLLQSLINLHEKKIRIRYDLKPFMQVIQLAQKERNFTNEEMDKLSDALLKVTKNYNKSEMDSYLTRLNAFLTDLVLYKDRYRSIRLKNADYDVLYNDSNYDNGPIIFQAVGGETEEPEEIKPKDPMTEPYFEMPQELGAVIHLKSGDLEFASLTDTFNIVGTEGYYLFEENTFKGQDGIVNWENVDIPESEMRARVKQYDFKANESEYKFEYTRLSQPQKTDQPVIGLLELNIRPSRGDQGTYPRFTSYDANIPLKGVGSEKLSFSGGVSYKGANFYSSTFYNEPSTLIGSISGEKKFKAKSKDFVFNSQDSTVTTLNAEVVLYHDSDSIVHPAVEFMYNYRTDEMTLETSVDGYKTTPFRTSYYNFDLVGDLLSWNLKSDSLDIMIKSARADVPLIIESKDFYSEARYNDLAQIFSFHPLIVAVSMAQKTGGTFRTDDLAREYRFSKGLVEKTMSLLMSRGMVKFDPASGEVTVLEKGYHYLESRQERKDYDDILIPSISAFEPNATMNFKDSILTVRGVRNFVVSDSLDVLISPTNEEIRIKKNRDIEFDGSLNAGNFEYIGTKFTFEYDSFRVNLENIDSLKLQVNTDEGRKEALENQLIQTSGVLIINEADNKSSSRSLPNYPIFTSSESATIQFGREEILGGAYDSCVYFDVPPFKIDSVADADPSKYAFEGTAHTCIILPEFKEKVRIMEDRSFGFIHAIPDTGYNLYQTGGRLYGEVQMDNSGLTSPGRVEFLTGTFNTERATLYLDSMYAENGLEATIKGGFVDTVSFPAVAAEAYDFNWKALNDSLIMKNKEEDKPFQIFDDRASLNGQLILKKSGLLGKGTMNVEGSFLESDSITFEQLSFESKNTTLTINSSTSTKPILSSENVLVNFDIENQQASIEPEVVGEAALEFPFAQFKTSIPAALWDVNEKTIVLRKPDEIALDQSFFYSTNERLDSLAFNADEGFYNMETKELNVKGIPFIKVADAKITPEGNELNILENSRIEKLQNAVIVIDTANAYHRLYDAEVEILSRTSFRGKGTYELVNAVQDTFSINFDQFQFVEDDKENGPHTKSSGTVKPSDGIRVSPGFIFEGQVTMYAYKKALELDGAVRLDLDQLNQRNVWIEYYSNDSIEEVIIPFDEALTKQGQPLNAGIHFANNQPYMSFITEKQNGTDDDLFVPKGGGLYFDSESETYRIENANKRADPSTYFAGSMFSYDEIEKEVTFEGKLNFLSGNDMINIQSAGKGKGNLDSLDFEANAMFAMRFGLSIESLAAMGQNLKDRGEELGVSPALDDRSELIYKVAEFIGDDATRIWDKSYEVVPTNLVNASAAGELLKDLVITDVNLKWSRQNSAFYSTGKIGVSNVSNIHLDMELDGFMEIQKRPDGDRLNLLIQMTDGIWYYFNFGVGSFSSFSSDSAYNTLVNTTNSGKNKVGNFRVFANTLQEVNKWVMGFRAKYYGIDEPYRLQLYENASNTLKKKTPTKKNGF